MRAYLIIKYSGTVVLHHSGWIPGDALLVGTWHRKLSARGRPLRWTRHALAQAAGACVLWDEFPEAEALQLRSKPGDIWRRLAVSGPPAQPDQRPPQSYQPPKPGQPHRQSGRQAAAQLMAGASPGAGTSPGAEAAGAAGGPSRGTPLSPLGGSAVKVGGDLRRISGARGRAQHSVPRGASGQAGGGAGAAAHEALRSPLGSPAGMGLGDLRRSSSANETIRDFHSPSASARNAHTMPLGGQGGTILGGFQRYRLQFGRTSGCDAGNEVRDAGAAGASGNGDGGCCGGSLGSGASGSGGGLQYSIWRRGGAHL